MSGDEQVKPGYQLTNSCYNSEKFYHHALPLGAYLPYDLYLEDSPFTFTCSQADSRMEEEEGKAATEISISQPSLNSPRSFIMSSITSADFFILMIDLQQAQHHDHFSKDMDTVEKIKYRSMASPCYSDD